MQQLFAAAGLLCLGCAFMMSGSPRATDSPSFGLIAAGFAIGGGLSLIAAAIASDRSRSADS